MKTKNTPMKEMSRKEIQEALLKGLIAVDKLCEEYNINYYLIGGALLGAVRNRSFIPWDNDIDIAMMRKDYDKFLTCAELYLKKDYFIQNYGSEIDFYPPMTRLCIPGTYVLEKYSQHLKFQKNLYLDIFPLDTIPEKKLMQWLHKAKIQIVDQLIFYKLCMIYNNGPFHIKFLGKKTLKIILLPISLHYLQKKRETIMKQYNRKDGKYICNTGFKYGYKKGINLRSTFGKPTLVEFEGHFFYAPEDWDNYLAQIYENYWEMPPEEKRRPSHEVFILEEEPS